MLVFNYVFTNVINLKLLGTECCDFFLSAPEEALYVDGRVL